jgi:hypothetical protein
MWSSRVEVSEEALAQICVVLTPTSTSGVSASRRARRPGLSGVAGSQPSLGRRG